MELIVNDLSLHQQFHTLGEFFQSMNVVIEMRNLARQYAKNFYCHRGLCSAQVTPQHTMQQAVQSLDRNQRTAVMIWLTQNGPFWDDDQVHTPDDWLEYSGNIVTESAIGEAAVCCWHKTERHLISFSPSDWEFSPVPVNWVFPDEPVRPINITNHWDVTAFRTVLQSAPATIQSWTELEDICKTRCPNLIFTTDCFESLQGQPFVPGASDRIRILLDTLEELRCCVDAKGLRTQKGDEILANHFSGGKAWFTDSSTREKNKFEEELKFLLPDGSNEKTSCTWHGKIKWPQFRIHISDPFHTNKPLYIAYIGPKITKD